MGGIHKFIWKTRFFQGFNQVEMMTMKFWAEAKTCRSCVIIIIATGHESYIQIHLSLLK